MVKFFGLEETLESYSKRVDGNPYLEMNDSEKRKNYLISLRVIMQN